MTTRRAVLAAAGTALAAGCLSRGESGTGDRPGADADPSPTDDEHTGAPRGSPDCTAGVEVMAGPFAPAEELPLRLDDEERSLVAAAVEAGVVERSTYAYDLPVPDRAYVEHHGTYYETSVTRVDRTEVPARLLDVAWENGQEAPDGESVVAFEGLPDPDRTALRLAIYGPAFTGHDQHPTHRLRVREYPAPYPDGTGDSRLVADGETWVRWDGRTYRARTGAEATNTRHTVRLAVSRVADGASGFREHVADRHLLALSGLSDAEREILRRATASGYEECEPVSDGLATLRERLSDEDRLPPPRTDAWYVAFEGSRYELTLLGWEH